VSCLFTVQLLNTFEPAETEMQIEQPYTHENIGCTELEHNETGSETLVYPGWGGFIFKSFAVKASRTNMLLKKLAKRSTSPTVLAE
jgi:hypothetical protein